MCAVSQQETPEEAAVRERVQSLGGSVRKNADGRIDRVIVEREGLTLEDMQKIGKLTHLEWIRVGGPAINDSYVEALKGLTSLKIVDIENSSITDKSLEILKELPLIETLNLRRNLQFTDQAIKLFAEFPNLKTLQILYNGFSDMSLYDLDKVKSVRVLDIRALPVGDDTLMCIADLENLEEIRIRSGSVTNEGIAELKKCKKLKVIELQDAGVTAGLAEVLKDMENLRSLRIFRCANFGAKGISELGALTQLETLELRDMACSNEALLALKPLDQLKIVEFSELSNVDSATMVSVLKAYPKLENIRIFAIPVDDTVAEYLATVPALKHVSLPATAITNKGLEALAVLSLTMLDIHGNKILLTPEGAKNALGKFKALGRVIIPETLDTPEIRSILREKFPRCVITVNTYSQEV
jgi:Ran GTPase-activating protein (RanGAP) involved in mRNA processing and transport